MHADEQYMARAIQLAELGRRVVAPNPMVGCVIVHNNKIIGEGYHMMYGGPHAEVNAIDSVDDPSVFSDSTLYVTLEPCSHFGKTPPCADLIIENQFNRVVIGSKDPNDQVNGKGIARLQNAGIEVTLGILEDQCKELNKHFFTAQKERRPFILLKWAQTINGLIDNGQTTGISWISGKKTQITTHRLRSHYHAILVGRNTVEHDNPTLNVRAVEGIDPIKVVVDPQLVLDRSYSVFKGGHVIVLNLLENKQIENINYVQLESLSPLKIVRTLHELGIQSILIEGGAFTLNQFIENDLWDEALIITGDKTFDNGTSAPVWNKVPYRTDQIEQDILHYYSRQ